MKPPTWRRIKRALGFSPPAQVPVANSASRRAARLAADAARDQQDWAEAARLYTHALEGDEGNVALQVQQAHALKEAGRLIDAEAAYRRALADAPESAEIQLHLGHLLRLQARQEDAANAYAQALLCDPTFSPARDELIAIGARGRMPHHAFGRDAATQHLARLSASLQGVQGAADDWAIASTYPVQAWDAFRRSHSTPPIPRALPNSSPAEVWIDARHQPPSAVRRSLDSLLDQSAEEWRATVVGDPILGDHPVASLAARDPRVVFTSTWPARAEHPVLVIQAGAILQDRALEWLSRALAFVDADVVYADHDHHSRHWRDGATFFDPALFGAPDADDLDTSPVMPAAIMASPAIASGADSIPAMLRLAVGDGRAAHLPLVLTSVLVDGPATDLPTPIEASPAAPASDAAILVVIPTRDEAVMLQTCVESLRASADRLDRLEILILDNRSREPATRAVLENLESQGHARWREMDEPFNWARFNNLASAEAKADILVFCNNDVEALSAGWDSRVRENLARHKVGVVGARLLYPDRTLQHAGVVLGRGQGRPIHEGLHSRAGEAGPLARWNRRRRVAAVTGAFMALRQTTFERVGGFDEGLAVGYNDMDMCLRVRAAGLGVIYDPALTLIHHESKTRGASGGEERTRWDDAELERLYARWGADMMRDMSINPRWVSAHSRVFDGFRDVGSTKAVAWLRWSAGADPWRIGDDADDDAL